MMKIRLGLSWYREGHMKEVTKMLGNDECEITETWIAEDTGKDCKDVSTYKIAADGNEEYIYEVGYEKYAKPGNDEYDWWARTYATGAINWGAETEETTDKEEDNEMKITGLENAEKIFQYEGAVYTQTKTNYFFKTTGGRGKNGQALKMRIPKHAFEAAYENYLQGKKDAADAEDTKNEIKEEDAWDVKDDPKAEEKKAPKKTKKARRSKDIAHESHGVTLTAKQVDFIRHIPDTCFYENGLDSTPWCDVLADEIGGQFAGKPMTVGAMISTLREKNLICTGVDKVNGRKAKFFNFTELGKEIARELGLA